MKLLFKYESTTDDLTDIKNEIDKLPDETRELIRWKIISSLLKVPQTFEEASELPNETIERRRWKMISSLLKIPKTF